MRRGTDGVAWVAMTALFCVGALVVAIAGGWDAATPWPAALDWRPDLGVQEPWRLWTSAWVHWSGPHLAVNLAGAAVVGAIGWRARAPRSAALAWFVAWPLTHLLMALPGAELLQAMREYGGLSGVLHAGVIVLGLTLAWPRRRRDDIGAAPRQESGFVATRASLVEPSRITEGPWAMTSLEELSSVHTVLPASTFEAARPPALTPAQSARHRWIGAAILVGTIAKVVLESPWDLTLRPSAMLGIAVAPLAHLCGVAAGAIAWGVVTGIAALAPRLPRD